MKTKMALLYSCFEQVYREFPRTAQRRSLNRYWHGYRAYLKRIAPMLDGPARPVKWLDLGAGSGVLPLVLAKAGFAKVTLLDSWKEYAPEFNSPLGQFSELRERFERHGIQWRRHAIGEDGPLPFDDEAFDCVSAFDVIEHLKEPGTLLTEAYRLLKPGGHFVITTANTANLRNRLRLLLGRSPHPDPILSWYIGPFFGHIREYTVPEMKQILEYAGFALTSIHLSEASHWNTQLDNGEWLHRLKLNSPKQVVKGIYLGAVALWPNLKYLIIALARKAP